MPLDVLKSLRFITPGVIIVLFWSFLGSVTGDWKLDVPESASDIQTFLPAIIAGLVYYLTPLRDWANKKHFLLVNENIRQGLIRIGSGDVASPRSDWQKLRRLFYKVVDSDESLKVQAKRAYFNGYIWTTVADVKALSLVFAVYALLHHFVFDSQGALIGFAAFSILAALCWPVGAKITEKHLHIGDEQISTIEQFHRTAICEYFSKDE